MIALEQYNKEYLERYKEAREKYEKTKFNSGVLCSKCNIEMLIDNPNLINASIPPSQWITCPKCKERKIKYYGTGMNKKNINMKALIILIS